MTQVIESAAEAWNAEHPTGTRVIFERTVTSTAGPAFDVAGGGGGGGPSMIRLLGFSSPVPVEGLAIPIVRWVKITRRNKQAHWVQWEGPDEATLRAHCREQERADRTDEIQSIEIVNARPADV